jgi:hypothetical protein
MKGGCDRSKCSSSSRHGRRKPCVGRLPVQIESCQSLASQLGPSNRCIENRVTADSDHAHPACFGSAQLSIATTTNTLSDHAPLWLVRIGATFYYCKCKFGRNDYYFANPTSVGCSGTALHHQAARLHSTTAVKAHTFR